MADKLKELQSLLTQLNVPQNDIQVPYAPGLSPEEDKIEVNQANKIVEAENAPKEPTRSEKIDWAQEISAEAAPKEPTLPKGVVESGQVSPEEFNALRGQDSATLPQLDVNNPQTSFKEELETERSKDKWSKLLNALDKSFASMSAANENVVLKPTTAGVSLDTDRAKELLGRKSKEDQLAYRNKQLADLEKYRDKQLGLKKEDLESRTKDRSLARQLREEGEKRRQDKQDVDTKKKYLDSARSLIKDDPRFKKAVEQGMEFESVDELLGQVEEGNQAALGALGTKLARAMGEVGVLTDTDVVRYVAGQSWGRKLKDWYTKGAQGELSESTLSDIKENLSLLRSKLGKDTKKVYDNATGRMKTAYPELEEKKIKGLLGFPINSEASEEKEPSRKDGDTWSDDQYMYRMSNGKVQRKKK